MVETVQIPSALFEKMARAIEAWDEFLNDWEDYMLSQSPEFLEKMRRARAQHLAGETCSLDELERRCTA